MILTKTFHLEMAHRLTNYVGKCSNLHGHRYLVTVELFGAVGENSMVLDFNTLKELWKPIDTVFDHSTMLEDCEENAKLIAVLKEMGSNVNLVKFNPTAENMAKMFYELLQNNIDEYITTHTTPVIVTVKSIKVEETEGASATYVG